FAAPCTSSHGRRSRPSTAPSSTSPPTVSPRPASACPPSHPPIPISSSPTSSSPTTSTPPAPPTRTASAYRRGAGAVLTSRPLSLQSEPARPRVTAPAPRPWPAAALEEPMSTNNLELFLNKILNDPNEWARFRKEPVQMMQAANLSAKEQQLLT